MNDLAIKHHCDKRIGKHGYTVYYDRYFSPLQDKRLSIMEIGVRWGGSLRMWEEFFPQAKVYGVDNQKWCTKSDSKRIKVFIGDQTDVPFLDSIVKQTGKLDIVIDDGSHMIEDQMLSFRTLWPHVAPGGMYIIEDAHCAYQKKYHGGYRKPESPIEQFKNLVDDVNFSAHRVRQEGYFRQIEGICFYRFVIFIWKWA